MGDRSKEHVKTSNFGCVRRIDILWSSLALILATFESSSCPKEASCPFQVQDVRHARPVGSRQDTCRIHTRLANSSAAV